MNNSRFRPLTLASTLAFVAGCGQTTQTGPQISELSARIIFYQDTSRIVAPDSVTRGVPFAVSFLTYAGGCTRAIARTEVIASSREALIRPYNRQEMPPNGACTDDLLGLRHDALIQVDTPGNFTIRVRGRRQDATTGDQEAPAELTRIVTVR